MLTVYLYLCYTFTMDIKKLEDILSKYDFLLFGSHASGKDAYLSDIDLAIETNKELDLLTYGELLSELETFYNKKIDLIVTNELYRKNPKIAFNITDNHEVIFIKDKNRYIDFKVNSLKYYFDTMYMYKMFDKSLQERLENGTFGKVKAP